MLYIKKFTEDLSEIIKRNEKKKKKRGKCLLGNGNESSSFGTLKNEIELKSLN